MRAWRRTVSSRGGRGRPAGQEGHDVEEREGNDAERQPGDDELELFLEEKAGRMPRAVDDAAQRDEREDREMEEVEALETGLEPKGLGVVPRRGEDRVEEDPQRQERGRRQVDEREEGRLALEEPLPLGEDHEEMEEQGREGEEGGSVDPVENAVQEVEVPRRGEGVETIERRRKEIEIQIRDRQPPAGIEIDDEADDERRQADQGQVEKDEVHALLLEVEGRRDELSFPADLVADLLIDVAGDPERLDQVDLRLDGDVVDGVEDVALLDAGEVGRAVDADLEGREAVGALAPGHPVGRLRPGQVLIEIDAAQGDERQHRKEDRRYLRLHPKN